MAHSSSRPIAIDLFTGLHGWSEGLVAEGFRVIGFDIENMCAQFGQKRPDHVQLVLQDVLTIHGSQFKDARLIVASPPCQEYSYMAMPWSLAKQREREYLDGTRDVKDLTRLFDACFRIQREACEVAGRHIPMVVENVRGAQKWVGRAKWNFGSFYLWGDVPALMPIPIQKSQKAAAGSCKRLPGAKGGRISGWPHNAEDENTGPNLSEATKVPGFRFDGSGRSFQSASVEGVKVEGLIQQRNGHGHTRYLTNRAEHEGVKSKDNDGYDRDHPNAFGWKSPRSSSGNTSARKAASAQIAKIPLVLARHIASVYRQEVAA